MAPFSARSPPTNLNLFKFLRRGELAGRLLPLRAAGPQPPLPHYLAASGGRGSFVFALEGSWVSGKGWKPLPCFLVGSGMVRLTLGVGKSPQFEGREWHFELSQSKLGMWRTLSTSSLNAAGSQTLVSCGDTWGGC